MDHSTSHKSRRLVRILFVLFLLLPVSSCTRTEKSPIQRSQLLMGTLVDISISSTDPESANRAADLAFDEIRRIEKIMSTYIPESEISQINDSAGKEWMNVHPELLYVIQEALRYSRLSEGAFDISFKPLTRIWSFKEESWPPERKEVEDVLPLINYENVLIDEQGRIRLKHPGMSIGLGGIAKGYAVDRAMAVLEEQGISHAIVNAGGDMRIAGRHSEERPWRVGIQDPRNPSAFMTSLSVTDSALTTSGDYEKFFVFNGKRYHHLLDPQTGFPAMGCQSVTILCPTAMMADAMATAVFILGPEKGMALIRRLTELEGMIVDLQGKIQKSEGFPMYEEVVQ